MRTGTRRIPDALLERYLASALPEEHKARLEGLLSTSAEDQARLRQLRADSEAFLLRHPPGPWMARLEQQRRSRQWRWAWRLVPALAAVAAVVLLWVSTQAPVAPRGPVALSLHLETEQGRVPVGPDVDLHPGDSVHLEVKGSSNGFAAVLSRDSRGVIRLYHSNGRGGAATYDVALPMLPGTVTLSEAPEREDLYALHSVSPFELKWAVQALGSGQLLEEAASQGIAVGRASFMKSRRKKPEAELPEISRDGVLMPNGPGTVNVSPDGEPGRETEAVLERREIELLKLREGAGIGLLKLSTEPPVEVYDGEVRLGTTPLTWVFKAGTYRLRLVDANGDSRLFSVEVKTDQENEYTVRFSDLPRDPR
ncbi:MAG TPA: hypothetical protein VK539_36965 [Myxococcaceae bacterium]|nr:hypothetical protein [Myxococcaceae bacterium]